MNCANCDSEDVQSVVAYRSGNQLIKATCAECEAVGTQFNGTVWEWTDAKGLKAMRVDFGEYPANSELKG